MVCLQAVISHALGKQTCKRGSRDVGLQAGSAAGIAAGFLSEEATAETATR